MSKKPTTKVFKIDDEIDKVVQKATDDLAADLKARIKRLVVRSEKLVLKQYIASQRETARMAKVAAVPVRGNGGQAALRKKAPQRRGVPRREKDYAYQDYSDSEESSS